MKSILQVVQELIKPYIDKVAKNIAPVEVSPSEHSYTVGKSLIFKGVMYKVTSAIAVNDELEVGVNIIADTDVSTKKLSTYTADATAWDTAPTASSTKPVTSGGVKTALDNKENKYTVITQTLAAGATQITFTDAAITADASVSIQTDPGGINWTNIASSVGSCIITYPAQSSPIRVRLLIRG